MVQFSSSSSTITMTRGDGVRLNISINTSDGESYAILPTDVIQFLLFKEPSLKANSKALLTKTFSHPEYPSEQTATTASTSLTMDDTRFLDDSEYYYAVKLTHRKASASELVVTYSETVLYGRFILVY